MVLERIRLANFRNYRTLDVTPAPGLNMYTGANAQGKSNLLEAIAMLATGKSFRARRESELVRRGEAVAEIAGDALTVAGALRLHCTIDRSGGATRKRFGVNGATVGYARFLGRARVVTFVPADLALISGSPALRRAFLNAALAQGSMRYYRELARYQTVIAQKSALLRGVIAPDRDLLLAYNEALCEPARIIIETRAAFVDALATEMGAAYARWNVADEISVRYAPSIEAGGIADALAAALPDELRRRTSLVGPHRDDLVLELGGVALAAFGSQGQQRTAVLALKVAEYEVARAQAREAPLLLLDDVLSELDEMRARAFFDALRGCEQAFVTTTGIPDALAGNGTRFWVADGAVTPC